MEPTFFETPAKLRKWLAANHDKKPELSEGVRQAEHNLA
jgi:hypothetical protein